MSQAEFERNLSGLTAREKHVLELLVSGKPDAEIAKALNNIHEATVRKHIEKICNKLGIEKQFSDKRRSRRTALMALVAQNKTKLLGNSIFTVVNEGEPALTHEPTEFDLNFVGRDMAITELNNLVSQGAKVIVIQAAGGVGKTTLAQEYLKTQGFELVIELTMAKETESITAVESVIEEWLKYDFKEEPGREFGITLGRLKRQLQTRRVGILIDNLEPALDQEGKFIEPHRRYVELLRVLADSTVQSVTLMTSRERLCESGVTFEHYRLPGLDEPAWYQFFSNRNINIDAPTLKAMHNAYGGNAKAMRIFCGEIREDFDGDMAAYRQENGADLLINADLKDLITSQFERLQEIYPEAYKLLCRLGCFRYQDVPTVPTQGLLCLLWDVPEVQKRRVIESLRNRSLVEFNKGKYWLHPVIRAEGLAQLRESKDWETANRQAADFWTESVEIIEARGDALKACEAYYHYREINDLLNAGQVLIKQRKNKWEKGESLGAAFYRLGLLNSMISSIMYIISKLENNYIKSYLNNILGNIYWIMGNITDAIKCLETSSKLAKECHEIEKDNTINKFDVERLKISSRFDIGLCNIDLYKIESAVEIFEEMRLLAEDKPTEFGFFEAEVPELTICLAFLYSELGQTSQAVELIQKVDHKLPESGTTTWGIGYTLIFLALSYKNIGEHQKAYETYNKAIVFADESNYTQVKAKALYGLAELYREQGDFDTALTHHLEAIELLDKIGAKCDLAEAYYQLALTYQKMGETENAGVNFQKAIQLYTEMEALKQVEKVLQAMGDK